ncbi:hypothetical protein ABNX05_18185 [Lysinibacillus sp. M3]|uniref:Phage tail-like C-terminal domain-containing protein n=1 Tax=Lysinibacillus zambalensis TaxID=3160866 RepID=A0ABV1MVM2_9BACI
MVNWSRLGVPRGVYISPAFFVSNTLDKYIANIKETLINVHNQTVEYYYRVSYNQVEWTDWERLFTTSYDFLDNYTLAGLYIQLQIVMVADNEAVKPYLQKLEIDLKPYGFVENTGDLPIKPKIWIRKKNGKGNIAIINFTTGQRVEFKDLNNSEEIYVDCENEEIVSSNQVNGVYRYDSHNDEYLELVRGSNYITSEGDFDLDIRHKAILLQE